MANSVKNFVALVVAMIKGDDAKATAIKIQKKATMGLTAQIAVKDAVTLELEENVESAVEALNSARANNGELIKDTSEYIVTLLTRKKEVTKAKEALASHQAVIDSLKEELELINS